MKKILGLILFLTSCIALPAQINLSDSTVQSITYWNKNEAHEYKIINKRTQLKNEELVSCDSVIYNVEISVLDSTANSYFVQWQYKGDVNKGLKIIYKTNELGEFEEVVNWGEVKDFLDKATDAIIENAKEKESADSESLDKLKDELSSTFSTKQAIETVGVREIVQFHMFHGVTYKLGELLEAEVEAPNVVGPTPFIADVSYGLEEIYSDESYLMKSVQTISKEQLKAATLDYLKKLSESMGKPLDMSALQKAEFENEIITYSEIHDSGWVIYSLQQTKVTSGETTAIKECSIELLE